MIRSAARPPPAYPPVRNDDRIILHFDYDCFYAQVVQNNPPNGMTREELAGKPVGVTQKSILATCNYEARRLGVRKLMRIADAVKVLPSLVLVDGEDLSPFRDASKALYRLVQDIVLAVTPVERLGLDEFFIDATALVDANVDRLTKRPASSWSASEFFAIGDGGFAFDCTQLSGCVVGAPKAANDSRNAVFSSQSSVDYTRKMLRFVLGSHLAAHVRSRLHRDGGYTSSGGIATSKLLAKLAGKQNKPANQTTILSLDSEDDCSQEDSGDSVVHAFMDVLPLRGVPGIGYKTATLLSDYIHGKKEEKKEELSDGLKYHPNEQEEEEEETVTVATVRQFPGMSPRLLDSILGSAQSSGAAGSAIPSGDRVWQLLHGVDALPVRGGRDLPTQISIEDTYAGPRQGTLKPEAAQAVAAELRRLAASLLKRMHVDLLDERTKEWAVKPKTLRLTLRPQLPYVTDNRTNEKNYHFARMSRSEALPGFVLSLTLPREQVVERLVQGSLVPMFRKLAASVRMPSSSSSSRKGWTIGLLNVCVANMAPVAGDGGIAAMFQKVKEPEDDEGGQITRESDVNGIDNNGNNNNDGNDNNDIYDDDEEMDGWDDGNADTDGSLCKQCGQFLPAFAMEAHTRFHLLGED